MAISTNETFPCAGTTIRLHQSWAGDTVVVDITGFIQPTPCYQGADAATGNVLLKGIDRDYFILELRRGRENDLWKITKSEQTYKAISINNSFTTLNE